MRIVVHDYSGHPGQVHLSRELARRGHDIQHQFCSSFTTGRGATELRRDDPRSFSVRALALPKEFTRYQPAQRIKQELRYALAALRAITAFRPDAVVLSNVPLISLFVLAMSLRVRKLPYVLWQQDIYSDAIASVAKAKIPYLGVMVSWVAIGLERVVARSAEMVVPISDTFVDKLVKWGVPRSSIEVIPNWAAIDEMPQRARDNEWARAHGLVGIPVVMYAGTLGLKHDPSIIAQLAGAAPAGTRTVVVSQGLGRDWLEDRADNIPGLKLLDYQPYEVLPDVLASADIFVVLLERDASQYSVPSKVLNYLCVGRPIIAILPKDNAAARQIEDAGAGVVVEPDNAESAIAAISTLLSDDSERERMGAAAREYAERTFDVGAVAGQFETVLKRSSAL